MYRKPFQPIADVLIADVLSKFTPLIFLLVFCASAASGASGSSAADADRIREQLHHMEQIRRALLVEGASASDPVVIESLERRQDALLRHLGHLRTRILRLEPPASIALLARLYDIENLAEPSGRLAPAAPWAFAPGPRTDKGSMAGFVTGRITSAQTGEPIPEVAVILWTEEGFMVYPPELSDAEGNYRSGNVPEGTYYATTTSVNGYLDELYEDKPCAFYFAGCVPQEGTPIFVTEGTATSGIDFVLERGGVITGTLTDAVTGEPAVEQVEIRLWTLSESFVQLAFPDQEGVYVLDGLPSEPFYVAAFSNGAYADQLYDGVPCPGGAFFGCQSIDGTPVEARVGETVSGIDFALEQRGQIAGTVIGESDGQPLPSVEVQVWDAGGNYVTAGFTDRNGAYSVDGLADGTYFVSTESFTGYQDELHDDIPCPRGAEQLGCDPTSGTPVETGIGQVANVDFALTRLATVSGFVRAEETGQPLPGVLVRLSSIDGLNDSGFTDGNGRFTIEGVLPGRYFGVTDNAHGYLDELYDDLPCDLSGFDGCVLSDGTPIDVPLAIDVTGIDFDLTLGGSISGTLADASTGDPLSFESVHVWTETSAAFVTTATTDNLGGYFVPGLVAGIYFVTTMTSSGHVDEIWDDVACPEGCDPRAGTPVLVALGATSTGVDFTLDRLGSISGAVTKEANGEPLANLDLRIHGALGSVVATVDTGADGSYFVGGLAAGTYFASTGVSPGYLPQVYDGLPCTANVTGMCGVSNATPIAVGLNETTTGVDFSFPLSQGVEGTVTNEASGSPLAGIAIDVWDDTGSFLARAVSGTSGRFSIALAPGVYFASTRNEIGAVDELWDDLACPDGPASGGFCDPLTGTPIVIDSETGVLDDVDFELAGLTCTADATDLCLNDGRFRVAVAWKDPNGKTGSGQAQDLTDDSGYFWFFSESNIELVIKVLDGCFAPFDAFWVFAAGLTTVETEITVTDTLTGVVKSYFKPQGASFEPILDVDAFPTCDASAGRDVAHLRQPAIPAGLSKQTCAVDREDLCVAGDRFRVEAFWETRAGQSGPGQPVILTGNTGYFWFFSADNVEVVVKVLDACRLGNFNRFWVFAAGLTNVEVTLRVTDTVSGQVKDYVNPLGTPFQPVLDTNAFDTCP